MSRIPLSVWLIASLCLLGVGACLFKAGLPGLLPRRGMRTQPAPFQHPDLPPMVASDVDGGHDWDGFLRGLTATRPSPGPSNPHPHGPAGPTPPPPPPPKSPPPKSPPPAKPTK